jgi:enoyl-CoA hydratase
MSKIIFNQVDSQIGVITVNRPEKLNALNLDTLVELYELLTKKSQEIKILIITGSGDKSFIAGADIKEMNDFSKKQFSEFLLLGHKITKLLEQSNWISIAAVNGFALGGGTELALACDLIFASENAVFGLPEVKLGIIPGFGGTFRLSRKIPINIAKEIIFKGTTIKADQALKIGLVNRLIESKSFLNETIIEAQAITKNSLNAVLAAKVSIDFASSNLFNNLLMKEFDLCTRCFDNYDRVEGMSSFSEKRSPRFSNDH